MNNFLFQKICYYGEKYEARKAIIYKDEFITYGELIRKVKAVAKSIKKRLNFEKGKPVVIYYSRGIDFIVYQLAVLWCASYYIPVDRSMPRERVKDIYADIDAKLLITDDDTNQFPESFTTLNIEGIRAEETLDETDCPEHVLDHDLVYVIYTSGTSGKPKGVKIMYRNLKNLVSSFYDIVYKHFDQPVKVGVMSSFGFDASVKQIYNSLYYGHTLVIADDTVRNFGRKIHMFHNRNELSVCDGTPSQLKLMLLQKTDEYTKVKYMLIGGENLNWSLLHQYKNKADVTPVFINLYGPTECCVDVSYHVITELNNNGEQNVTIGKPLHNTELFLLDEQGNVIQENNKPGELCVTGKQVGAGYVNILSENFVGTIDDQNYMYKTGDLAIYNNEHSLVILHRKDRQVKLNGYRIELDEISSLIEDYLKCQCISIVKENSIVSFLVNAEATEGLKQHLKEKLPRYMLPKKYCKIEQIPITTNGKINEAELERFLNK